MSNEIKVNYLKNQITKKQEQIKNIDSDLSRNKEKIQYQNRELIRFEYEMEKFRKNIFDLEDEKRRKEDEKRRIEYEIKRLQQDSDRLQKEINRDLIDRNNK
jgi:chromosome segregation ATPase